MRAYPAGAGKRPTRQVRGARVFKKDEGSLPGKHGRGGEPEASKRARKETHLPGKARARRPALRGHEPQG